MKHLYMIGGPMGVGKTTVCQALKRQMNKSVFLDGDWCWDMNPFVVTQETKAMVLDNIVHMLTGFLHCSELEHIIFAWVMHEQEIIDGILKMLPLENCQVHAISLTCSKEALRVRLHSDIAAGLRTEDVIARSLSKLPMYETLSTQKIDTTNMTIDDVVEAIRNMETHVTLIRASCESAELIWKMQLEAFSESYKKYEDTDTNPAAEPLEKVSTRIQQPFSYYYLIQYGSKIAGGMRVVDHKELGNCKRLSPIFVLPPYRNRGIAQKAIREAERIHGCENWKLETILEEPGLCRLYEKLGYRKTGKTQKINDRLTLAFYEK